MSIPYMTLPDFIAWLQGLLDQGKVSAEEPIFFVDIHMPKKPAHGLEVCVVEDGVCITSI